MRRPPGRMGSRFFPLMLVATAVVATTTTSHAYLRPGTPRQVDLNYQGQQPPGDPARTGSTWAQDTWVSSVSADGRYVTFDSAYPLVPLDTNGASDIYLRDLKTDDLRLVSKGLNGTPAEGSGAAEGSLSPTGSHGYGVLKALSLDPAITPDGRFITFASSAVNLVQGDTNLAPDIFVYDVDKDRIERVSIDSKGNETGTGVCTGTWVSVPHVCSAFAPSISSSGRYVSFSATAGDLVADDTNGSADVFVHDRLKDTTTRVSVSSDGTQSKIPCPVESETPAASVTNQLCKLGSPLSSISGDGRFVAFDSVASNLVEGDTNDGRDVFVHDLETHKTERVSVATDGSQADMISPNDAASSQTVDSGLSGGYASRATGVSNVGNTASALISADGRYVAFYSNALDLVPNDSVSGHEVFVRDRKSERTERVTVSSDGRQATGYIQDADEPSMSASGRYVVWTGGTTTLENPEIPAGQADGSEVFLYDRTTGATEIASVSSKGAPAAGCDGNPQRSYQNVASVNATGRYVSFMGCAENLHPQNKDPQSWRRHIFVVDRGSAVSAGGLGDTRAPNPPSDDPGICIASVCIPPLGAAAVADRPDDVSTLITQQGGDLYGASMSYRPGSSDLFVRVQLEHMPLVTSRTTSPWMLYGVRFHAGDARYEVRIQRTLSDIRSTSGASFGLFRCSGSACTEVDPLLGGYGTTGDEVVFSLPLKTIGIPAGGSLTQVEAYSSLGSYQLGPVSVLDRLDLR